MPELLLEVGTEEMPAGAVQNALDQLREVASSRLEEARLTPTRVHVYGTPRRLILLADGVPQHQPDAVVEVRGPSRSVAFDAAGHPTNAARGFARKHGVDVDALHVVDTPQGEYVYARVRQQGKPAVEVLPDLLAQAVLGLYFPKMMRWGEGSVRFVRPIRWILALLGEEELPVEIAGVRAGLRTWGHRFLTSGPYQVHSASGYLQKLKELAVLADPDERRREIVRQANELASSVGGVVPWDEALLDENVWLVEYPTALLGRFDTVYLDLPRPVLVTAMKKHQRAFPIEDREGHLLPYFIAVRNGGLRSADVVREGYERVLTARFADARYFYEEDRKVSFEDMAQRLSRALFQEKLGTLAQKRERLEKLSAKIADARGMDATGRALLARAAFLAKADLASRMVTELPALQGIIGREYALERGEDPRVADAIAEHYLPRTAGDRLPDSPIGKTLAVADRLDTLVGYYAVGARPSGSSDPYGLRRAAQAVVQILAEDAEAPTLSALVCFARDTYAEANGLEILLDELWPELRALFDQRLEALLEERGIRYDLADAALGAAPVLAYHVYAGLRRAEALQTAAQDDAFVAMTNAAGRVANILAAAGMRAEPPHPCERQTDANHLLGVLAAQTDARLLHEAAERALYAEAEALTQKVAQLAGSFDFAGLYAALVPMGHVVDRFFDEVLVMTDDSSLRNNRLALLRWVDGLYRSLADFSKVVVA